MTARRLVLLRHGQTSWNEAGRAQGHADISLDATGHAQAAAAAPYLAAVRPVALWSSDLARARETCGYVAEAAGLSVKHDERLREFDVGARQGLTLDEFAVRFPDEHAQWVAGDEPMPVAGGETADDVCARMVPVLRECLDSLDAGRPGWSSGTAQRSRSASSACSAGTSTATASWWCSTTAAGPRSSGARVTTASVWPATTRRCSEAQPSRGGWSHEREHR